MTEDTKASGFSRRTIVKGAAWSVPVIATSLAVPAAAASGETDLVPTLSGPINLSLRVLGLSVATVTAVNRLTITNNGDLATSASGTTVSLSYNPSLLSLNISGIGVTVLGSAGNYTLSLPSIAPGGQLAINLGTTLNSLLTLNLLTQILGGESETMLATVAGDYDTSNNATSEIVGISIL